MGIYTDSAQEELHEGSLAFYCNWSVTIHPTNTQSTLLQECTIYGRPGITPARVAQLFELPSTQRETYP